MLGLNIKTHQQEKPVEAWRVICLQYIAQENEGMSGVGVCINVKDYFYCGAGLNVHICSGSEV